MGRIEERFKALRDRGEKALIAYVTAGDPGLEERAGGFLQPAGDSGGAKTGHGVKGRLQVGHDLLQTQ
jgi:hypothetical protein